MNFFEFFFVRRRRERKKRNQPKQKPTHRLDDQKLGQRPDRRELVPRPRVEQHEAVERPDLRRVVRERGPHESAVCSEGPLAAAHASADAEHRGEQARGGHQRPDHNIGEHSLLALAEKGRAHPPRREDFFEGPEVRDVVLGGKVRVDVAVLIF